MLLTPVADTALRDSTPANNFGASTSLPVGVSNNGSPRNRALVRFSLAAIPPGATITAARLRLVVAQSGTGAPSANFELHRVLKDWGEGSKTGLPAVVGEATWNSRFHLQSLWSAGGGQAGNDFATPASAVAAMAGTGSTNEFSSPTMAADVQTWLANPAANFGWLLMAQGESIGTGRQVGSREDATNAPVLELQYTAFAIYNFAQVGNAVRFSFNAEPNRGYTVEFRDALDSGNWATLTNIPASPAGGAMHITNTITSPQRFYRLRAKGGGLLIYNAAKLGSVFRFSFDAEANRAYTVEFRDLLHAGTWVTLTNISPLAVDATLHITNTATGPQRFFRLSTP